MREAVWVLCGELAREPKHKGDPIRLDVGAPAGSAERVNLSIEQISMRMVTDIPDRLVDLLEIAAYVYAADQLKTRGGDAMRDLGHDWRRDFQFVVPVRDFQFWKRSDTRRMLQETLGFLADDDYRFDFKAAQKPLSIAGYLGLEADGAPVGFAPDRVVLFSGGLDSLAGVASSLLQRGERLAVVSHSASTAVQGRQQELIGALRARCPQQQLFHIGVRVTRGLEEPREFTQRTRSFLFASLAFVVARLFGKNEVTFYENGIVSVNLPIAEHVVGARATRTTHPRTLADFSKLFGLIADEPVRVTNPYFWFTKADVLHRIADAGAAGLIAGSFSCSHVRLWVKSGQQCGICTQCIDRRFAVLAAGLEAHDPEEGYQTDLLTGERADGKELVVAESFVLSARRFSKLTQTALFGRYGELLRVLPYLDGDIEKNATQLFELYRRHGLNVVRVANAALAETTLDTVLTLPPTCLLSLLRSPGGFQSEVLRDPVELEPPARERAQAPSATTISVSLNRRRRRAVVGTGVVLTGTSFDLIATLADYRNLTQLEHRDDEGAYFPTARLMSQWSVDGETVRRRVMRCRKSLSKGFREKYGETIADDAVVQSSRWNGYRLNPNVLLRTEATADSAPVAAGVTSFSRRSRLSAAAATKQGLGSG